jgi:cobalt-precorrin-7 (C5)-methyltransferase
VAVLRVGDPCVSSSLTQLLMVFKGCDITIIPSVGSVQFSAAAARICIDESVVISFHDGRREIREEKLDFLYECFTKHQKHLIVLTDETQMPPSTARYLLGRGLAENTPVIVCENLTLDDEQIFRGTLGQTATKEFGYTTVLVIRNTPLRPA